VPSYTHADRDTGIFSVAGTVNYVPVAKPQAYGQLKEDQRVKRMVCVLFAHIL